MDICPNLPYDYSNQNAKTLLGINLRRAVDGTPRGQRLYPLPKKEFPITWSLLINADKVSLESFFKTHLPPTQFVFFHIEEQCYYTVLCMDYQFVSRRGGLWDLKVTMVEA